jgi:hypothetical protein
MVVKECKGIKFGEPERIVDCYNETEGNTQNFGVLVEILTGTSRIEIGNNSMEQSPSSEAKMS